MVDQEKAWPPIRDAGTLIIVRSRSMDAMPEILMIRRAETLRFAGGAMVFPGGVVDDADHAFASSLGAGHDAEDMAARIAAVRETIEECGLALTAAGGALLPGQLEALRDALHEGRGLGELAHSYGLRFDFDALIPFTRWCPRSWEVRVRYDARFYIAVTEGGHDALTPDGTETSALCWSSASDMLARAEAGEARLLFPTRCVLERLAGLTSVDELLNHARAHPPGLITPWLEMRNGEEHVCIPDGYGYPVIARPAQGAVRS
ncbi:MAG: NUDIX hydrolase [Sphingobium sp.]|nr:NUDIX hydrolase [Sphingobium sp.]